LTLFFSNALCDTIQGFVVFQWPGSQSDFDVLTENNYQKAKRRKSGSPQFSAPEVSFIVSKF